MLNKMDVCRNVYRVVAKLGTLVGDKIHTLTDGEREIIAWLLDEGLME